MLRRRRVRRRRAVALIGVVGGAVAVGLLAGGGSGASSSRIALVSGGQEVANLSTQQAVGIAEGALPMPVARRRVEQRGTARIALQLEVGELRARLREAAGEGGEVALPERAVASRIRTPVVQQEFPNNCETAALSMLLATVGVERDQLQLQRLIAKDGPLDPVSGAGGERVWGDPERGFVGRVEGSGVAGGFGVYQAPVIELARRWASPRDLSGSDPSSVYERLLEGHAVFAWVGLSDGPYESWVSPRGREVTVNYGEHTVLLVGVQRGGVLVNDPLDGRFERWSKQRFESMWQLLDRRAVSL